MKKLFALLLFVCLLLPRSALAVSITIHNNPSGASLDSFNIDVSVLGASTGKNYLRAEIYKDGTSNYFGETYNGSSWYKGSTGTSYYPITIIDSKTTASATLQVRVGTPTLGEYSGPGAYKLKIRRYTSSGNAASSDDSSPVDLTVNYQAPASPTPTPKSSSTNSTSSSSTKTTSVKVSSTTPTKQVVSASTAPDNSLDSVNTRQVVNNSDKIATDFAKVQNISVVPSKKPKIAVLGAKAADFSFIPLLLGLVLIGGGVGFFVYKNWDLIKTWIQKE